MEISKSYGNLEVPIIGLMVLWGFKDYLKIEIKAIHQGSESYLIIVKTGLFKWFIIFKRQLDTANVVFR